MGAEKHDLLTQVTVACGSLENTVIRLSVTGFLPKNDLVQVIP